MTIEELLEIEEIKQLRNYYALYLDSGEIEKLVALFVEDGIAEFPEHMGGPWVGRERMFKEWSAVFNNHGTPFGHLHVATNPFVRLTGPDTANGRYYAISVHTLEKDIEKVINVIGIHDDLYRKIDGKWYFEKTRYDFLYPERLYQGPRTPI
jgi:hypothetical protein